MIIKDLNYSFVDNLHGILFDESLLVYAHIVWIAFDLDTFLQVFFLENQPITSRTE